MNIVCVKCHLQMRPAKIGVPVESMMVDGPYKLFMGDRYECSCCGFAVAAGMNHPVAEHYQADYAAVREVYHKETPVTRYWATLDERTKYDENLLAQLTSFVDEIKADPLELLINYVVEHTARGECQCGKCIDKGPDRPAPEHSVDLCFFWVSARNNPTKEEFERLILAGYPDIPALRQGPSYIKIGADLGDQEIGLRFIALGKLVGAWDVATPELFGFHGEEAKQMAGNGLVMPTGWQGGTPA